MGTETQEGLWGLLATKGLMEQRTVSDTLGVLVLLSAHDGNKCKRMVLSGFKRAKAFIRQLDLGLSLLASIFAFAMLGVEPRPHVFMVSTHLAVW